MLTSRVPEPVTPNDSPPRVLGGYTLLERLGRGGMGEVWRAERISAGGVKRRAAVKRILPEFQGDGMLRERFLAEARITARLEHPNVVQLLDFGDDPELYLVLEYIDGISVADLMRRAVRSRAPIPVAASLLIASEAAVALDYAHRRSDDDGRSMAIVHRDVSPPNILLSTDGAVKLADFGIARAADNKYRTASGVAVGKLVYMAPEQARGEAIDRRVDVFALGVVLWETLTLRPLISRDGMGEALAALDRCAFDAPSKYVRGLPPAIDSIVATALHRDPARRWASAGKMGEALRAALHAIAPTFHKRDLAHVIAHLAPEVTARAASELSTPALVILTSTPVTIASPARPPRSLTKPLAAPSRPIPVTFAQPFARVSNAPTARRRWGLPVVLVVAVAGASITWWWWGSGTDEEPADPPRTAAVASPPLRADQAAVGMIRACALAANLPGLTGTGQVELAFSPLGTVATAHVSLMTNGDGTQAADVARCAEADLRGVAVAAAGAPPTSLTVAF